VCIYCLCTCPRSLGCRSIAFRASRLHVNKRKKNSHQLFSTDPHNVAGLQTVVSKWNLPLLRGALRLIYRKELQVRRCHLSSVTVLAFKLHRSLNAIEAAGLCYDQRQHCASQAGPHSDRSYRLWWFESGLALPYLTFQSKLLFCEKCMWVTVILYTLSRMVSHRFMATGSRWV